MGELVAGVYCGGAGVAGANFDVAVWGEVEEEEYVCCWISRRMRKGGGFNIGNACGRLGMCMTAGQ